MIRVGHRRQKDDTLFLYFTVTKWFQEIDDILQFLHFGLATSADETPGPGATMTSFFSSRGHLDFPVNRLQNHMNL